MSAARDGRALDALLAEYRPPAPPEGMLDRVAAAALTMPQEPALAPRAAARRDRRGSWLRRPIVLGGAALGLAFSSAVAATLAGASVELPPRVQRLLAEVPLLGVSAPEEDQDDRRAEAADASGARSAADAAPAPAAAISPPLASPPLDLLREAAEVRRRAGLPTPSREQLDRALDAVAERRAAGLPTPRADRLERHIARNQEIVAARRAAGLPTPRADRLEQAIERNRAASEKNEAATVDDGPDRAAASDEERLAEFRRQRAERLWALRQARLERLRQLRRERLRQFEAGRNQALPD